MSKEVESFEDAIEGARKELAAAAYPIGLTMPFIVIGLVVSWFYPSIGLVIVAVSMLTFFFGVHATARYRICKNDDSIDINPVAYAIVGVIIDLIVGLIGAVIFVIVFGVLSYLIGYPLLIPGFIFSFFVWIAYGIYNEKNDEE